jgi:hypothetical protein
MNTTDPRGVSVGLSLGVWLRRIRRVRRRRKNQKRGVSSARVRRGIFLALRRSRARCPIPSRCPSAAVRSLRSRFARVIFPVRVPRALCAARSIAAPRQARHSLRSFGRLVSARRHPPRAWAGCAIVAGPPGSFARVARSHRRPGQARSGKALAAMRVSRAGISVGGRCGARQGCAPRAVFFASASRSPASWRLGLRGPVGPSGRCAGPSFTARRAIVHSTAASCGRRRSRIGAKKKHPRGPSFTARRRPAAAAAPG